MSDYNHYKEMAANLEEEIRDLKREIETLRERLTMSEQALFSVKTTVF